MIEKTCNDCLYYDVLDGFCTKGYKHCYGYEDACDDFKQETDTGRDND